MTSSSRYHIGSKLLDKHKGNRVWTTANSQIAPRVLTWGMFLATASLASILTPDPALAAFNSLQELLILNAWFGNILFVSPFPQWLNQSTRNLKGQSNRNHASKAWLMTTTVPTTGFRNHREWGKSQNHVGEHEEAGEDVNQPSTGNTSVWKTLVAFFLTTPKMKYEFFSPVLVCSDHANGL